MITVYCTKGHENQDSNRFCQICGEKLPLPAIQTLIAGNVLEDRYRIVQQIGQGGFGRTYLCENLTRFNEPCVLKEFAPQVQGTYALQKAKTLFEREASVLHNLQHNQIPRFRELFEMRSGGQGLFLVQDYVAGQTYRYLLATKQNQNSLFSEAEIKQLMIDTLPVLEYIHSLGVIHRDIAPDNLMLRSSDNLPVLIDFGGVKQIAINAEIQATGNTDVPTCLGKVGYAPHEQMQRGTVAPNSDLYALAATSLVLLTGQEPTELIDPQSLNWNWHNVVTVDPQFRAVIDRMLQPNPAARFQSATDVLKALQAVPQMPATAAPNKPSKSAVNTVVVSPGATRAAASNSGAAAIASSGDSSFLQILGRSWLAMLVLGLVGAGAWAGISMFGGNKSDTPIVTPSVSISPAESTPSSSVPSSSSSPSTASVPSNSPQPSTVKSEKPEQSDADKPNTDRNSGVNTNNDRSNRERVTTPNNTPRQPTNKNSSDNNAPAQPQRSSNNRRSTEPAAQENAPAVTKVETYNTNSRNTTNEDTPVRSNNRSSTRPQSTRPQTTRPQRKTEEETPTPRVETYNTNPKPDRKQSEASKKPQSSNGGETKKPTAKEPSGDNDTKPLF
jgi:serine/threonine protein kinase